MVRESFTFWRRRSAKIASYPFAAHHSSLALQPHHPPLTQLTPDGLFYGTQTRWQPRDGQDRSTMLRRRRRAGARGQGPASSSPAQKQAVIQCLPRGPSGSRIWYWPTRLFSLSPTAVSFCSSQSALFLASKKLQDCRQGKWTGRAVGAVVAGRHGQPPRCMYVYV